MSTMKLREFIKKIRLCKTMEEERMLVNKESANIRNLSKEQAEHHRCRSLLKCMFMELLGYPTEFIHMTCLSLLASTKFTEKKLGYLGVCILLNEQSEILLLTSHTIANDLENQNQYIVASALNALGEIGTPDMCREASSSLFKCLSHTNVYIKKKAALALTKVISNCPELLDTVGEKLNSIFEEKNHGALLGGLALAISVFKKEPKFIKKYKKYVPALLKLLKSLSTSAYQQEFDMNGIADPFLQVKILEIIGQFATIYEDKNDELANLLATIPQSVEASTKNTGNAVLYELVKTIFNYDSSSGLKTSGSNIIGKFLENKDNNMKYIALNILQNIAKIDLSIVQKHKNMILEFINDLDISIKRRSLDLTYLIVNETNIKQIVTENLKFLATSDNDDFKQEMTSKIFQSLEKYSPSIKWEIDTIIKMLCIAEDTISESIISSIINVFITSKDLHKYSMFRLFVAMRENLKQKALLKVGIYLLGELGEMIIDSKATDEDNEVIAIEEKNVIELIKTLISSIHVTENIKEIIMNCCFKLMPKVSQETNEEIRQIFEQESRSFLCEVQERANEYLVFTQVAPNSMQGEITKNIPLKKDLNTEDICSKEIIVKEFEEEGNSAYQNLIGDGSISNTVSHLKETRNNDVKQPKQNQQKQQQETMTQSNDLFDIFSTSSNNVPATAIPIISNPIGVDSTGGLGSIFNFPTFDQSSNAIQSNPIMTNQPNQSNPIISNDIFSQLNQAFPLQQPIQQQQPIIPLTSIITQPQQQAMVPIFQNSDLCIYTSLSKSGASSEGCFYASNNCNKRLTNVKINFGAKKNATFKVISTSGNALEPNASLGIKKEVSIFNNDTTKPVVVKVQIAYTIEGRDVQESCMCDNL